MWLTLPATDCTFTHATEEVWLFSETRLMPTRLKSVYRLPVQKEAAACPSLSQHKRFFHIINRLLLWSGLCLYSVIWKQNPHQIKERDSAGKWGENTFHRDTLSCRFHTLKRKTPHRKVSLKHKQKTHSRFKNQQMNEWWKNVMDPLSGRRMVRV